MKLPDDLLYSKDHEWVRFDGQTAVVGITDYAQDELGDVVFIELPEVDSECATGDAVASVESVKAVSEVYTPVSGEVKEVNSVLEDRPELINDEPYGKGWIFKIRLHNPDELDDLISAAEYRAYLEEL